METLDPGEHNLPQMTPTEMEIIGAQLAVKWNDGTESFIALESLRRYCPCAGCQGERDIMGNLYKGPKNHLTPVSFELRRISRVGGYAVQLFWTDGHSSGIFSYDYLRRLAEAIP